MNPADQHTSKEQPQEKKPVTEQPPEPGTAGRLHDFLKENQWFWGLSFIAVVTVLFMSHFRIKPPPDWNTGAVATKDIRAPFDLQVTDEIATKARKEEAGSKVPPVYDWDSEMGQKLQERLSLTFQAARGILQEKADLRAVAGIGREDRSRAEAKLQGSLEELLGQEVTRYALHQFEKEGFSPTLEENLRAVLMRTGSKKIVSDEEKLSRYSSIKVRDIHRGQSEWEIRAPSTGDIVSVSTARRFARDLIENDAQLTPSIKAASEELIRSLIRPSLTFNSQETAKRQETASKDVPPLVVFIKKGQPVIRTGETVDENVKQRLSSIQQASQNRVNIKKFLALLAISVILLFSVFMYFKTYRKTHKLDVSIFNLTVGLMILLLVITHLCDSIFKLIAENAKNPVFARADLGLYLVPFAAGAVIVTLLVDRHIAVVFSVLMSFYAGVLLDLDFRIALYSFLSSLAAIYAVINFRQKRFPFKTALFVAAANMVFVLLLTADDEAWSDPKMMLYGLSLGFLSSMPLKLMLVATLLPLLESFYGLVSDVRLLELSSLSHPLLQKLALEAPGTYNHSIMISHLSETAASSIGANGLFCRVAAYYHDIGKSLNPGYFVENQHHGHNPHDKLTPRVSALIVQSHVKEGMKLAKTFKLPQQIIDIIPEHHGTRRISYFYDRALTIVDPSKETIHEADFCYPGPPPKTREAAIIMLADSIEASSRVLKDPSSQRIRSLIEEIFQKILSDGQLNDCEITLKELAQLKEAFYKALVGVFARRISYPNYDFDKDFKDGKD